MANTPATTKGTNGFAIASLICGFLPGVSLLAIVFGFVALSQVKQTGESGRGMAIAGIILGIAWIVIAIIWFLAVFFFVGTVTRSVIESANDFNEVFNDFTVNTPDGNFNFSIE
jgi:hypothetical protein